MTRPEPDNLTDRALFQSPLTYHLRGLREDATHPELPSVERLALVRDRETPIRGIRAELEANHVRTL